MEMDKEMNIIYPFVSIIIPSYNRSKLITITLDSLLEQTYPHDRYEIIVVDNRSTDETPTIVKQYEQKTEGRVRYFYEGRQGSHYARNNVVKYAKGELLYFTDDDMQTDAKALEELVKVMVTNPNVGSVTGKVPSIEPWFNHSIFVNPILSGAGLRTKVLHAMVNGVPVMSTRFGAEGCYTEDEKEHLVLFDSADEFITGLQASDMSAIGGKGKTYYQQKFNKEKLLAIRKRIYKIRD